MDIRPISPNIKPSTQPTPGSTPRSPQPATLRYSSTPSTLPASPQPPSLPAQPTLPSRPKPPVPPSPQSIYPTPVERPFQSADQSAQINSATAGDTPKRGLFGSIPTGVVVISILTIISGIGVFLTPSTSGAAGVGVFVLLLNVLLAFGLFSLNNVARIIFIVFSSLAIFSSGIRLLAINDLQSKTNKQRAAYTQQIEKLRSKQQTNQQAEAIAKLDLEVKKQEGLTSSVFARAYVILGVQLASSVVIIAYLMRPSVKDRFE